MANKRAKLQNIIRCSREGCETSTYILKAARFLEDMMFEQYQTNEHFDIGYHEGLGSLYVMPAGGGAFPDRLSEKVF